MISSLSLARALGLSRSVFSKRLTKYNRENPSAPIVPDEVVKGKRGKPAQMWDEERIRDIASKLGCSLEVKEVK